MNFPKKSILLGLFLFLLISAPAPKALASKGQSAAGGTGLGIVLGEPSGFVGKHYLSPHAALDAGIAFSLSNFFLVYGDYLWHFPGAFAHTAGAASFAHQLTPYIGVGGELFASTDSLRYDRKYFTGSGSTTGFGLRIPLGLEWRPAEPPIGVFFELVPGIGVLPDSFGFFQSGIGIRWYF